MRLLKTKKILRNKGSPFETPASTLIDLHYAQLRIVQRWDWERFERLCTFLRLTPGELASLVCLRHSHIPGIRDNNVFPESVALLLTLIEADVLKDYAPHETIQKPFPSLNHGLHGTTQEAQATPR
jgi:hypothetical protein